MIWLMLITSSEAATYAEELKVVQPVPSSISDDASIVIYRSWDVGSAEPDQQVASDWSYVTCELEGGVVRALFEATKATWPITWPATASCSAGGYTLVLNLVAATHPANTSRTMTPSVGIAIASQPDTAFLRTYDLPMGPQYVEGTWDALLSPGVSWPGVECTMAHDPTGAPLLQVVALHTAPADAGFCVLDSPSGVPHSIALEITR